MIFFLENCNDGRKNTKTTVNQGFDIKFTWRHHENYTEIIYKVETTKCSLNNLDHADNAKCHPIYAATNTRFTCISPINGRRAGSSLRLQRRCGGGGGRRR